MLEGTDKRQAERLDLSYVTYVRKALPDGNYNLMQFSTKDLSQGGVFITSDDLSLLEVGEECEVMLEDKKEKLYQTQAKVVRGARVFTQGGEQTLSGFGLMFFDPEDDFLDLLQNQLSGGINT
jgi:hypothetical protein